MQDVPVSEKVADIDRECDKVIGEFNALNEKYKKICESVNELFDLACDSMDRMSQNDKAQENSLEASKAALQKAMEAFQNRIDELKALAEERRKKESYNSGGFSIAGIYP